MERCPTLEKSGLSVLLAATSQLIWLRFLRRLTSMPQYFMEHSISRWFSSPSDPSSSPSQSRIWWSRTSPSSCVSASRPSQVSSFQPDSAVLLSLERKASMLYSRQVQNWCISRILGLQSASLKNFSFIRRFRSVILSTSDRNFQTAFFPTPFYSRPDPDSLPRSLRIYSILPRMLSKLFPYWFSSASLEIRLSFLSMRLYFLSRGFCPMARWSCYRLRARSLLEEDIYEQRASRCSSASTSGASQIPYSLTRISFLRMSQIIRSRRYRETFLQWSSRKYSFSRRISSISDRSRCIRLSSPSEEVMSMSMSLLPEEFFLMQRRRAFVYFFFCSLRSVGTSSTGWLVLFRCSPSRPYRPACPPTVRDPPTASSASIALNCPLRNSSWKGLRPDCRTIDCRRELLESRLLRESSPLVSKFLRELVSSSPLGIWEGLRVRLRLSLPSLDSQRLNWLRRYSLPSRSSLVCGFRSREALFSAEFLLEVRSLSVRLNLECGFLILALSFSMKKSWVVLLDWSCPVLILWLIWDPLFFWLFTAISMDAR